MVNLVDSVREGIAKIRKPSTVQAAGGIKTFALITFWVLLLYALYCFLVKPLRSELQFDDAFMFTRYLHNVKNGWGMSWNSDEVHTFGPTSLPWVFFIAPFTLVLKSSLALRCASMTSCVMALVAMSWVVLRNARSSTLSNPTVSSLLVVSPLLFSPFFRFLAISGMETMLAVTSNAIFIGLVLGWQKVPSKRLSIAIGISAFCVVAIRPEGVICALMVPFLAWRNTPQTGDKRNLRIMCGIPFALFSLSLIAAYAYFGTPVPLSFYAKSTQLYKGFIGPDNSGHYLLSFFLNLTWQVLVILALGTSRSINRFAFCFLPAILTFFYLLTVHQIMGSSARFYMPYLPYFVIPAMLILDDRLIEKRENFGTFAWVPKVGFFVVLTALVLANDAYRKATWWEAPQPKLNIQAKGRLPSREWFFTIRCVSKIVAEGIPNHGIIAASEVGYLGDSPPNIDIIDLVGLNDATIARHGFSMNYILSRKPELIWFPHSNYTALTATAFSDRTLLQQYVVIAQAFNYGIAIRKDAPHRDALMSSLRKQWSTFYPGFSMDQFIVRPS